MNTLWEKINAVPTLMEKAQLVWAHYVSRRMQGPYEPQWIHAGYDVVRRFVVGEDLSEDEQHMVKEIVGSHMLKDGSSVAAFPGMPNTPMRIVHDGWKSGTPTWVFMGRSFPDAVKYLGERWVGVQRSLPQEYYKLIDSTASPPTLWIAYNLDRQMGLTALSANCVGPAIYFEELILAIEQEIGGRLPENPAPL